MNKEKIDTIAAKVVDMGLTTPVLFLLEAHIPLSSVFHTLHLGLAPLSTPLFGSEKINIVSELLSDRANINTLIEAIELKAGNSTKAGS